MVPLVDMHEKRYMTQKIIKLLENIVLRDSRSVDQGLGTIRCSAQVEPESEPESDELDEEMLLELPEDDESTNT